MKTQLLFIFILLVRLTFSQCDTSSTWSSKEKVFVLTQSPYYYGEPFVNTLKAIAFYVGDLPLPPTSEDYFKQIKRVFYLDVVESGNRGDSILESINEYFDEWQSVFSVGSKSLSGLKTFFNSQKMKSVKAGDKEQLKSINSLLTIINGLSRYESAINALISAGGSLRECVLIIVRCSQPIVAFDGSLLALKTINNYQQSMPNELAVAIQDIIALIEETKNSFLINLSYSKTEILNTILDLGSQIYSGNESTITKIISKYFGSKNVEMAEEYYNALKYIHEVLDTLTDYPEIAKSINPAIQTATIDIYFNKIIFSEVKNKATETSDIQPYIESVRFLLLLESINNTNIAEVLNAGKKIKDNSAAVKEAKNIASECIKGFSCLSAIHSLQKN